MEHQEQLRFDQPLVSEIANAYQQNTASEPQTNDAESGVSVRQHFTTSTTSNPSHTDQVGDNKGFEGMIDFDTRTIANSKTPLLRLPQELKDYIWSFHMPKVRLVFPANSYHSHSEPTCALAHVCKQLHSEMGIAKQKQQVYIGRTEGITSLSVANQFFGSMSLWIRQNLRRLNLGRLRVNRHGMTANVTHPNLIYSLEQGKFFDSLNSLQLIFLGVTFDTGGIQEDEISWSTRGSWLAPFLRYQEERTACLHNAKLEMAFVNEQGARARRIELLILQIRHLRIEGLGCVARSVN